jgi:hypothetical protein
MLYANLAASRLDKNYLTSVEQIGMHVVEGLDLSYSGVEALGYQPERVAPLYLVVHSRSYSGCRGVSSHYSMAAKGNLQALTRPDATSTAQVIGVHYASH